MDVPVYNMQGSQVGSMPIDEKSLGGTINAALIKQAYVMYHANLRQGSARTKTRAEVEGWIKKIYKQKGAGRARHSDRKPPHFKGGGHTFAKHRRREHYHLEMPKKMRRAANPETLLTALAGATEEKDARAAEFLLSNMSSRMADSLREEIAERGAVKPRDAEVAMTEIVAAIRELQRAGEMALITEEAAEDDAG